MAKSFWAHFGLLAHFGPFLAIFGPKNGFFFKFEAYIRNQRVFAVILSINMSKKILTKIGHFRRDQKLLAEKIFFGCIRGPKTLSGIFKGEN